MLRSFYRFPEMYFIGEGCMSAHDQLMHVFSEVEEAYAELVRMETCDNSELARAAYGAELMDVIHAAETALRMEFAEDEVNSLLQKVTKKNADRGYYAKKFHFA